MDLTRGPPLLSVVGHILGLGTIIIVIRKVGDVLDLVGNMMGLGENGHIWQGVGILGMTATCSACSGRRRTASALQEGRNALAVQ